MAAPTMVLLLVAGAAIALAIALRRSQVACRREAQELRGALLASQTVAVAGRLLPSLAHDLGNQMIVLQMKLREVRRDEEEAASHFPGLREAADAIQEITRRLGGLAVEGEPTGPRTMDLRQVVEDAVAFARGHTQIRHCDIDMEMGTPAPARVQPALARALLFHLLLNAAAAGEGRRRLAVRVLPAAGGWAIRVEDDGPPQRPLPAGISGLAVLQACAAAQGADVGPVASRLGGAGVEVRFPSE
jgi:signal transduction histidine kinase